LKSMPAVGIWHSFSQHTIPYGHFVTHHYFVIFNYRPQIYTTHLATSLNTFNIFPYPIPRETKKFHKEMIEIVFSTWHQEKSRISVTCQHCRCRTLNSLRTHTFVMLQAGIHCYAMRSFRGKLAASTDPEYESRHLQMLQIARTRISQGLQRHTR
jgi:hypothetical protein